jgi:diguanylate cyclase (GGDEF)-like protein
MSQLVEVVEYNLNNNTPANIDSFVSILATDPNLENIYVMNSDKIIIHSNRRVFIHESFEQLLKINYSPSQFSEILISLLNTEKIKIDSKENYLLAYTPIYYIKQKTKIHSFAKGFIFLRYNLENTYKEEKVFAMDKLALFLGESLILLLLLFYTFNKLISSRLNNLMINIENLEMGNINLSYQMDGNDEIATLFKKFHKMADKVQHLIYYDTTTEVYNRYGFEIYIRNQLKVSSHFRGLMLIDIDDFKEINDAFGHKFGDSALMHLANKIQSLLSDSENVGRVGGDEFLVLTKEFLLKEDLQKYIENFFYTLKQDLELQGNLAGMNLTMGVSIFPINGFDFNSLYVNAELALFHGKEGKYALNFIDDEIIAKIGKKMQIQAFIKSPTFFDHIDLYYQPILSLYSNQIVGMEALLRCYSNEMGNISPTVLIPILEETGKIRDLGKWVTVRVLKQITEWDQKNIPIVPVNINVSLQEFSQKDYPTFINELLKEYKISPDRIKLEITETEIMKNLDLILKNLKELQKFGVQIAIDDFGTGYSSLSYLKSLPVNVLKIDKSFIADVPENKNDSILVKTIIDLARSFGFTTVAEGVENVEEFEFLQKVGCDRIQGYFFSKPLPASDVEQLLLKYTFSPYKFYPK